MDPYPSLRGVPGQVRSVPVVRVPVPVNELILESEAVLELADAFACYCDHGEVSTLTRAAVACLQDSLREVFVSGSHPMFARWEALSGRPEWITGFPGADGILPRTVLDMNHGSRPFDLLQEIAP
jgi:hypothetical protein